MIRVLRVTGFVVLYLAVLIGVMCFMAAMSTL